MRDDYALINHPSMKDRQMNVSNEALYGRGAVPAYPLASNAEAPRTAGRLGEFETAAKEFVDAADAGAELDKYVKWFKALLA